MLETPMSKHQLPLIWIGYTWAFYLFYFCSKKKGSICNKRLFLSKCERILTKIELSLEKSVKFFIILVSGYIKLYIVHPIYENT